MIIDMLIIAGITALGGLLSWALIVMVDLARKAADLVVSRYRRRRKLK